MYSLWNKIMWGGDPEEINVITGLSSRDIYNIRRSWAIINEDAEKYGLQLFLGLFHLNPVAKTFFKSIQNLDDEQIVKNVQFRAHVLTLMTSIGSAVMNVHHPEVVIILMHKLGDVHRRRRVERKYFDEVKIIFLDILKSQLKAGADLVASWERFINFIYKHIFADIPTIPI